MAEMTTELALDDTLRFTPTWHAGSNPFSLRVASIRGLPVIARSTLYGLLAGDQTARVRVELFHGVD